jgi:hypothetical protein
MTASGRLLATLTPSATLTDDGSPRSFRYWADREILYAHGHINIEREEEDGLHLLARYRNDTLGRKVHLPALPGNGRQDQPHRHRPSPSPKTNISACGNRRPPPNR